MEPNRLVELMQKFSLNQYEAKAYLTLVTHGPMTAYQLSKESGIPRARIYDVLEILIGRGVVMSEAVSGETKTYIGLPVSVFLENIRENWERDYHLLEEELKTREKQDGRKEIYVSTLKGKENVLSFCRILIRRAERSVFLSLWDPMHRYLREEFQAAQNRGVHIRGITFGVAEPLDELDRHRSNEYMESLQEAKWFILAVDGKELMYGHDVEQDGNAFYTDDPVHIYLMEDYIWHDVLVNRMVEREGSGKLDQWILPEMEGFFRKKMLPPMFWEKKLKEEQER